MTEAVSQRLLFTGAAGQLGRLLRPRLARTGRELRLLDIAPIDPGDDGAVRLQGSVTDMALMEQACAGVDAVLHFGGLSVENAWQRVLDANINGSYVTLEAARRQGVRHVVLASSNHAIGYIPTDRGLIPADAPPRPDTNYGVSKAAMEAIGSLYADRYGMSVTAVRIGSCLERPPNARMLRTWLSPADAIRLLDAAIAAPPGFRVVWGASRNTRAWVSLEAGEAIGYFPQDDSEVFAEALLGGRGDPPPDDPMMAHVGGLWCGPDWDTAVREQAESAT